MTIRLLAQVANDPKGAVITIDDRRAQILIRGGYAAAVRAPEKPKKEIPACPPKA
jgi:hypothetical protein